jgi:16S rRNA (cytidine1402-2'-O)-methyltransferase
MPIGDPEDITLRALRVLRDVDMIVAEHALVTRHMLATYGITTDVRGIGAERAGGPGSLLDTLPLGSRAALVTDAGTPCVADAGASVVLRAIALGWTIRPVPGAAAVTAAVAVCGVTSARFTFVGFPPRARSDRERFFAGLLVLPDAIVLYESPRRLAATLGALASELGGERPAAIAHNLTRPNESIARATLASLASTCLPVRRGEVVIVIAPAGTSIRPAEERYARATREHKAGC